MKKLYSIRAENEDQGKITQRKANGSIMVLVHCTLLFRQTHMQSFELIGHEMTKLCSGQAENGVNITKGRNSETPGGRVTVLVHCFQYYCNKYTSLVQVNQT